MATRKFIGWVFIKCLILFKLNVLNRALIPAKFYSIHYNVISGLKIMHKNIKINGVIIRMKSLRLFSLVGLVLLSGCGSMPQKEQANPNIDMCYANYYGAIDPINRVHSTFTLAEISNLQATMTRFKQAATQAGYQIKGESYNNKEGILIITQPATGALPPVGYQIVINQDLGTISIAARETTQQANNNRDVDYRMCSLIASATDKPVLMQQAELLDQNELAQQREINKKIRSDALDQILQRALASGKSLVIMPALNLDSKYTLNQAINEEKTAFWADQTSTTIWQNIDNPKDILKVGYDESLRNKGLQGYVNAFVVGKSYYYIFIVNPGTYTISGHGYELKQVQMPAVSNKQLSTQKARLGQIFLTETENVEFYKTQEWSDAVYANRTVSQSYCTLTHVPSGNCLAWGSTNYVVQDQVQAGGWNTRTNSKLVSGLIVAANLSQNFASFKVNKGELVVVDGFVAEYPNASYNTDACQPLSQSTIQCALTQYSLIRVPAHLKDIQHLTTNLPTLSKLLPSAEYRQTTVKAAPGASVSGWGQIYTLDAK